MTAARSAETHVEVATTPQISARATEMHVEVASTPQISARATSMYIEVVVGAGGGWSVGSIRIG